MAFDVTLKFLMHIFDTIFSKQLLRIIIKKASHGFDNKPLVNDIIQKAALCIKIGYLINLIREISVTQGSWASRFFQLDKVKKKL